MDDINIPLLYLNCDLSCAAQRCFLRTRHLVAAYDSNDLMWLYNHGQRQMCAIWQQHSAVMGLTQRTLWSGGSVTQAAMPVNSKWGAGIMRANTAHCLADTALQPSGFPSTSQHHLLTAGLAAGSKMCLCPQLLDTCGNTRYSKGLQLLCKASLGYPPSLFIV